MRRLVLLSTATLLIFLTAWVLLSGDDREASPQLEPVGQAAIVHRTEPPAVEAAPVQTPDQDREAPAEGMGWAESSPATLSAPTEAPEHPEPGPVSVPAPVAVADPVQPPAPEVGQQGTIRVGPPGRCSVSLNRAVLARNVVRSERRPIGVSNTFEARGEPVWVFMEVHNPNGPEREMTIRWDHLDSDHVFIQTIPAGASPSWRTWVYHTIWPTLAGNWRVQIFAPGRCQVGEMTFEAVRSS